MSRRPRRSRCQQISRMREDPGGLASVQIRLVRGPSGPGDLYLSPVPPFLGCSCTAGQVKPGDRAFSRAELWRFDSSDGTAPLELLAVPGDESLMALRRKLEVDSVCATNAGSQSDRSCAMASIGRELEKVDPAILLESLDCFFSHSSVTGQPADGRRDFDP